MKYTKVKKSFFSHLLILIFLICGCLNFTQRSHGLCKALKRKVKLALTQFLMSKVLSKLQNSTFARTSILQAGMLWSNITKIGLARIFIQIWKSVYMFERLPSKKSRKVTLSPQHSTNSSIRSQGGTLLAPIRRKKKNVFYG
jgi:hypothetical protein